MTKTAKQTKAEPASNVSPFPVNSLAAYQLAAESLEANIWNILIDEIDANFPVDWACGILDKIKQEIVYLEDEE